MEADGGEAGEGRSEKSDGGFAFIGSFRFREDYFLSQLHIRAQDNECTVSADGERECFFLKGAMVFGLTANDEGNIEENSFAASRSRSWHGLASLGLTL